MNFHAQRNQRAFDRAQSRYDNMAPPEDEPYPCFTCEGSGIKATEEDDCAKCPDCDGEGWIGVDGEPCCDPREA